MPDTPISPLSALKLRETPNASVLLTDIKEALQRANTEELWERMSHAHNARYAIWEGHSRSCRKLTREEALRVGMKPEDIFPWPGAADMEVRIVDEIINEFNDLLVIAEQRAQRGVAPSLLDVTADERMSKAEGWGAVSEYYREQAEFTRGNAMAQWADIAWEYGHSILFVGWKEEKQVDTRTISSDEIVQLVIVAAIAQAEAMAREVAAQRGEELPEEGVSMLSDQSKQNLIQSAMEQLESLIEDSSKRGELVKALMQFDEDMPKSEALRVARELKKGKPVEYGVPVVVCSMPDYRALTPGLDIFYPPETTRIRDSPFIVLPEWFSRQELLSKIDSGWDEDAIDKILETSAGKALTGNDLFGAQNWVLSRGKVGMDMRPDVLNRPDSGYFQVLTVYYRALAMGGVPALYKTVIHGSVPDKVIFHTYCEHAHGRYPMVDYVRERRAVCMWDSRGVGELSFSEQEEIRVQTNARADNANLLIAPPIEVPIVPGKSGKQVIAPRVQIPVKRTGGLGDGIRKVDLAGDFSGSMEVEASSLARSNRYWLRGTGKDIDPIAKQNRQQRIANDWVASVKECERMSFQLIQQYSTERIRATALNGQPTNLDLTREDIQGQFSLQVEFDVGVLTPETVEGRMKMLQQYVSAMDREGLMKTEPLLRLMTMMINPTWSKLLVNDSKKAQQEDADDITTILSAALNGIEKPYVKGKNHAMRAQLMQQLIEMPVMDKDQPVIDPNTQRPVPNRILRIIQENPDVAELVKKRMEFESFQAQQFENAKTGRDGVVPSQPQAA